LPCLGIEALRRGNGRRVDIDVPGEKPHPEPLLDHVGQRLVERVTISM
jgi:hypothetical protein